MKRQLFSLEELHFSITHLSKNEAKDLISDIRNTTPDYILNITDIQIESQATDIIPNGVLWGKTDCMYKLNYGDLLTMLINYCNNRYPIDSAFLKVSTQLHYHKLILDDYITDTKTCNKKGKGPVKIDHEKIYELKETCENDIKWFILFSMIKMVYDIDYGNEFIITTCLSLIFGLDKNKKVYTTQDLRRQVYSEVLNDITVTMRFTQNCDIEYYFKNFQDVIIFEMYEMLKNNVVIKKCDNCGAFFFPTSRSDEKYCYYDFQGDGKNCKQKGYVNKINNDNILKAYRTIYKTQNARKNRNKSNVHDVDNKFEKWATFAKEQLKLCQNGEISLEDLKEAISNSEWINK